MNKAQEKIHIIISGGTIDSSTKGRERDVLLKHSAVPEYLRGLKLHQHLEFTEVFLKDSRDINLEDRTKILEVIQESKEGKIIVTHGTFTMAETGRFLKSRLKDINKTVIITGSMIPLKFENSDAPANLEFALAQVKILPAGVYICFNGRVLSPEEAVKNTEQEKFESIFDKK